ncbi:reverse transcriptase-like protein, partial [Leptotrombidium deliense]
MSIRVHAAKCKGPIPVPPPKEFLCADCPEDKAASFDTLIGLQLHRRSKHQHAFEACAAAQHTPVKARWTAGDVHFLAAAEAKYIEQHGKPPTSRALHAAVEHDMDRSYHSIVKARTRPEYAQHLIKATEELKISPYLVQSLSVPPSAPLTESQPGTEPRPLQLSNTAVETLQAMPTFTSDSAVERAPSCDLKSAILQLAEEVSLLGFSALPNSALDLLANKASIDDVFRSYITDHFKSDRQPDTRKRPKRSSKRKRHARKSDAGEYARTQHMFRHDRSTLLKEIQLGYRASRDYPLNLVETTRYWKKQFTATEPSKTQLPQYTEDANLGHIWLQITQSELERSLKELRGKAPGPDKLTTAALANVPFAATLCILNCILFSRTMPEILKESRTTLIAKTKIPDCDPSQYRPITIASVFVRCLHKIISWRVSSCVAFAATQRGFIPDADGTFENTMILDWLLRRARSEGHNMYIALLDIRKAFDSVSWNAIVECLMNRGFPRAFIEYMISSYSNSTTKVTVNNTPGELFSISRGVKQGDPLSPFIFNLVLDDLLTTLPDSYGLDLGPCRITNLAFADDTILVANSRPALQALLDQTNKFLVDRGMSLNAQKCNTVSICYDGKRKRAYCNESNFLRLNSSYIRSISPTEMFKYLGIMFNTNGRLKPNIERLSEHLSNLKKAKLKCNQKLVMLKQYVVPGFVHEMSLGRVTAGLLNEFDKTLRQWVKKQLQLPHWTPDSALCSPVKQGGLGIPSLRESIPPSLISRFGKAQSNGSPVFAAYAASQYGMKFNETTLKLCANPRNFVREARSLPSLKGFKSFADYPPSTNWMLGFAPHPGGKQYRELVKLRFNLLRCRANDQRGRPDVPCRFGCLEPGTKR